MPYYLLHYKSGPIGDSQWFELLRYYLPSTNAVEFNLLYKPNSQNFKQINHLPVDLWQRPTNQRIYPGNRRHYKLTPEIEAFISIRSFKDWYNFPLEDLSLLQGEQELLATVTHENYIICRLSQAQKATFDQQGFEFEFWSE